MVEVAFSFRNHKFLSSSSSLIFSWAKFSVKSLCNCACFSVHFWGEWDGDEGKIEDIVLTCFSGGSN